ncbi:DUF1593 domain-containing protein [Catenovulum sediminis]|uniref:DUF1593 domain-containing protein n=1 Tax=Catenovulum sediminis TaxID=1740262 RepID=UPI00117DE41B|nr:DUF1593 domain-containing protein [Catenovulum sediminis]
MSSNKKMMHFIGLFILSLAVASCSSNMRKTESDHAQAFKARVIHTTDMGADPDDQQSLIRQLVMANEIDIEGIITSTGCWKKSQQDTTYVDKILQVYSQVYPNLTQHAQGFPTPEFLQSVSVMGQTGYGMSDVGTGKNSAGSDLIIAAIDKKDPRPLWLTCWGGCNTIAQSLWDLKNNRSATELAEIIKRIRVYDVLGQDDAGTWIAKTFPELLYIRSLAVYSWQPSDEYLVEHIQSHGALGSAYPNRQWATEGDTPAFMHLINPALNDPDKVAQGGWGGRFAEKKQPAIRGMKCMKGEDELYDPYYMYGDASEGGKAISRWQTAYNNDFQARMDWTITPQYEDANHHPHAVVNGIKSEKVVYLTAKAGDSILLSASGSSDPDGDKIQYSWELYKEASSDNSDVAILQPSNVNTQLMIPTDAKGKDIHIILTIVDDGEPNLYAHRRIVISVK